MRLTSGNRPVEIAPMREAARSTLVGRYPLMSSRSDDKKTDERRIVTDGGEISVSHDFSAGDTITHQKMLVTCTVDEVDDSGHVTATDQRGGQHQFKREVVNRGLSEGFIERGES